MAVSSQKDTSSTPSLSNTNINKDVEPIEKPIPPEQGEQEPPLELSRAQSATYPPYRTVIPVMVSLFLSIFLVSLDRTIIGVAIPTLSNQFHSFDDIGWYGSAYLMTTCASQLLYGRIYSFYNVKWVFLFVIAMFELGSLVAATAPNSTAFIWGRAIQGLGAAGVQNGGIAIMIAITPLKDRPIYMAVFGAVFGVSSVLGPILGGVFTSDVSWRWCFYINLPLGGCVLVVTFFLLKSEALARETPPWREQVKRLDPLGNLLFMPAIVCLLLTLQWGGTTYPWSDGHIVALLVVFGVLSALWIANQYYQKDNATVKGSIIRNRNIYSGMWLTTMIGSSMLTMAYWLPTWFQAIKQATASHAGIMFIPTMLAIVVATISTGIITRKVGYYTPFTYASTVCMAVGAGLFQLFTPHTEHPKWIGVQVLYGYGVGLGIQQGNLAAQTVLSKKDVNTGVALMFFGQTLGGAIFLSVAQNILDNKLSKSIASIPGVSPQLILNTGATAFQNLIPERYREQALQDYNDALVNVFVVALATGAASALGSALLPWRSIKGKQGPSGADGSKEDAAAAQDRT